MVDKLAGAQRKMERIMLGINLRDRNRNTYICKETGISDIINAIKKALSIDGQVTLPRYLIIAGP